MFRVRHCEADTVMESVNLVTIGFTAGASALTAIVSVVVTYLLTRKRAHEAEWRKVKLGQYQEYVIAVSGIVQGRSTPETQRCHADAANSMSLYQRLMIRTHVPSCAVRWT